MKAGDFFAVAQALPFGSLRDICGDGGLVVVAPHPDDESLGCGGLIATACAEERSVRVIIVSDGTGSHAGSRRFPAEKLRDLREAEARDAVGALGLPAAAIAFLRAPDRCVPTDGPDAARIRGAIAAAAADCRAGAVCVTWIHDPHGDHVAAAKLVLQVRHALPRETQAFFYPVWGWTLPPETEVGAAPRGYRFDVQRFAAAKAAAVAQHRSQVTDLIDDDPDGFRLTDEMLANFTRPFEVLIAIEPDGTP